MLYVYLLSEDDFDDQVYLVLLEMLLSTAVSLIPRKLRRGGIGAVRRMLPLVLDDIRRSGHVDGTYFVVAVDNDRHPRHDTHATPSAPECRHCGIEDAIHQGMPDGRPIEGAVAVPVEMVEAWLLLMHDPQRYPHESVLPKCGCSEQDSARRLYGSNPPPQLKDLLDEARGSKSKADFAIECVLSLRPTDLVGRSPSFACFHDQVSRWSSYKATAPAVASP